MFLSAGSIEAAVDELVEKAVAVQGSGGGSSEATLRVRARPRAFAARGAGGARLTAAGAATAMAARTSGAFRGDALGLGRRYRPITTSTTSMTAARRRVHRRKSALSVIAGRRSFSLTEMTVWCGAASDGTTPRPPPPTTPLPLPPPPLLPPLPPPMLPDFCGDLTICADSSQPLSSLSLSCPHPSSSPQSSQSPLATLARQVGGMNRLRCGLGHIGIAESSQTIPLRQLV